MSRKICDKCGEINNGSAKYCLSCNASLNGAAISEDVTSTTLKSKSTWSDRIHSGEDVTYGTWIMILIGLGIPVINIIVIIGLAIQQDNETLSNFGKASLTLTGIGLILAVSIGLLR